MKTKVASKISDKIFAVLTAGSSGKPPPQNPHTEAPPNIDVIVSEGKAEVAKHKEVQEAAKGKVATETKEAEEADAAKAGVEAGWRGAGKRVIASVGTAVSTAKDTVTTSVLTWSSAAKKKLIAEVIKSVKGNVQLAKELAKDMEPDGPGMKFKLGEATEGINCALLVVAEAISGAKGTEIVTSFFSG